MTWIKHNITTIVIAIVSATTGAITATATLAYTFGGERAAVRAEVSRNTERLGKLENQKADETRWRVAQLEKRADQTDATLKGVADQLNKLVVMVERIDQRTSAGNTTGNR